MKVKKMNGLRRLSALLRKPLLTKHVRRHAQVTQDQVRMNTGQKVMFYRINKVQIFLCSSRRFINPGCHGDKILYSGNSNCWILSVEFGSCQPSGAWNFEEAPRFVENLCIPAHKNPSNASNNAFV